jgi:hypothetical protein
MAKTNLKGTRSFQKQCARRNIPFLQLESRCPQKCYRDANMSLFLTRNLGFTFANELLISSFLCRFVAAMWRYFITWMLRIQFKSCKLPSN